MNATVAQRMKFIDLVKSSENLVLSEIPMWAGLGGVRFLPSLYTEEGMSPETAKDEINNLNEHLVAQLRNTDSAFSLGKFFQHFGLNPKISYFFR